MKSMTDTQKDRLYRPFFFPIVFPVALPQEKHLKASFASPRADQLRRLTEAEDDKRENSAFKTLVLKAKHPWRQYAAKGA
jgi:hypothetical protein